MEWDAAFHCWVAVEDFITDALQELFARSDRPVRCLQDEYIDEVGGVKTYRFAWTDTPALLQLKWRTQLFPQRHSEPLSTLDPDDLVVALDPEWARQLEDEAAREFQETGAS